MDFNSEIIADEQVGNENASEKFRKTISDPWPLKESLKPKDHSFPQKRVQKMQSKENNAVGNVSALVMQK